MRVIIIGPPGAGKGEQCRRLAAHLGVPHISTGAMFRAASRRDTPTARRVSETMARGELIPDDLSIAVVRQRIAMDDCARGFLLDGYPRTVPQALGLGKALIADSIHLDKVLLLDIPDGLALRRITGRRIDPTNQRAYHIEWDPPPLGVASRAVRRDDDAPRVAGEQLATYHRITEPVAELYRDRDMLVTVDGSESAEQVHQRVLGAVGAA